MIALGSDHVGAKLKEVIKEYLDDEGIEYVDYGTEVDNRVDYPKYGYIAAKAVSEGVCSKGILFCGTGVGISLAANKVQGIRCVVCSEPYSARLSREHNDTNMLSLGYRVVGEELAKMIIEEWLGAKFEGGRHQRRVNQIMAIEKEQDI